MVATPIGNVSDFSPRARDILSQVDLIAAEDTRVTGQLLQLLGIKARLISVREHNEREMAERIVAALQAGQSVAQVSDAGTPSISDPGARLVEAVHAAGLPVCPIPGPSAVAAALSVSGFIGQGFRFIGFLPPKTRARREAIRALADEPAVIALYEAPHRLQECLDDLVADLGAERQALLAREISKTFETIRRLPLGELRDFVRDQQQARGECVLVLAPGEQRTALAAESRRVLEILLNEVSPAQAARLAAAITGEKRSVLYDWALAAKSEQKDSE